MEPPQPVVPRGPGSAAPPRALIPPLGLAAAAAATAAVLLSTGDVFAVALALAVVAGAAAPSLVAFLVAGSVLVRWGSSSLGALAGAQAVFGPAVGVGTGAEAASAAAAAAALLLAVPAPAVTAGPQPVSPLVLGAVPFGVLAAAVGAGPSWSGGPVVRLAATVAGVALAAAAGRFLPAGLRHRVAVAGGVAALVLAAG